ncbi:hypothetical protein [Pseudomonas tumuqii]|uniref:hypothetical protein n=1 Tax=Pseudomonas tumuqii TaxID=2715755 RepID=UPI0015B491FF|nr:hypothetical protein [Pseudomonas tumuqii]
MFGLVSVGIPEKNASNAASPPADAPIPTTGKLDAVPTGIAGSSTVLSVVNLSSTARAPLGSCAILAEPVFLFAMIDTLNSTWSVTLASGQLHRGRLPLSFSAQENNDSIHWQ